VGIALSAALLFESVTRADAWSHEYLAAIVDSTDDAVIGKTLDGTIISWNEGARRIYGYTATEVIGHPISILIPTDRPDELPAILARLANGERIEHYLTKRVRKDGSVIEVSVTISPVRDDAGTIIGASAIARDVTAQQEAVREALRLREQFVSVAAHELRTPLTTLYARLQLIERRLGRKDIDLTVLVRDMTLVRQAADRLKALIDRVLDTSRIQSGRLDLDRARTDLGELVRTIAPMFAETSGREINVATPTDSLEASVDAVRIEEVIVNLIDNAVKYSPPDTPIDLEVWGTPDAVRISVRDRGPGIPEQKRQRIFEPFYRASTSQPGVGLGLHISKEIVELHGGTLDVETPPDGGSRFVMCVPRIG
jgi:PAS domain S-box-containing protein